MIDSYSFGKMVIDGKHYYSDLMIYPGGRVVDPWIRSGGHKISMDDISGLVVSGPVIIVAGTGINGMAKPDTGLKEKLLKRGIDFFPLDNKKAVKMYNELYRKKRIGACFHLTC
jgi:hypothetical protein